MCGTNFWPEFGGAFLTPRQAPGIQTWSQPPELPGPRLGALRILRSPTSQSIKSGAVPPHLCWRGCHSHTVGRVRGPEFGWLTALAMGRLGVRTCLQRHPSGPGPGHTVTVLQRGSCLPRYPAIHSPRWGLLPASPWEERPACLRSLAQAGCPSALLLICPVNLPASPCPLGPSLMQ